MNQLVNVGALNRSTYIGSSDIPAILGVSPWKTPLDVYLDKIEGQQAVTAAQQRNFDRGTFLEPYIISMMAEKENLIITGCNHRYVDRDYDFLAGEIDAESGDINLEAKSVKFYAGKNWADDEDGVPLYVTAQVAFGQMVTDRDTSIVGAFIDGDLLTYRIYRDQELIDIIKTKAVEFWQRIQDRNPPDPITLADMARLYKTDTQDLIEADDDTILEVNEYRSLKAKIKQLEAESDEVKARIQKYMGPHGYLMANTKKLASWKSQTAYRFNQTAFEKDFPDLLEGYKRPLESRVFR